MLTLKRSLAILSAAVLTFSMAACTDNGNSNEETNGTTPPTSVTTTTTEPIIESVGDLDYSPVEIELNTIEYTTEFLLADGTVSGGAEIIAEEDITYVAIESAEDSVTCEFSVPCDGFYDVSLTTRASMGGSMNSCQIDNAEISRFIAPTGDWGTRDFKKKFLSAGTHQLTIQGIDGGAQVLKINIVSQPASKADYSYEVSKELSNENANDITKRLFSFLCDVYGKYTLTGQYADDGEDSRELIEIEKLTGEYPAILGLDLMDASPSRVILGGANATKMQYQAYQYWQKGGIITLCWHWNAPEDYLYANGEPWYRGFYTDATTFNLADALDGTNPEGYDLLLRDIDAIAAELKIMEEKGIPVLWRPLHEAAGGWFWWGASGADAYKELWILLYDRLTNYHGCNNLIWVWNGQSADWYPGDEYVDMISWDIYTTERNYSSQVEIFDDLYNIPSENKIIALSENGVIVDPDLAFADGARWSWYATWSGEFVVGENMLISDKYTQSSMVSKVYSHERVLTRDELPDITCYPID